MNDEEYFDSEAHNEAMQEQNEKEAFFETLQEEDSEAMQRETFFECLAEEEYEALKEQKERETFFELKEQEKCEAMKLENDREAFFEALQQEEYEAMQQEETFFELTEQEEYFQKEILESFFELTEQDSTIGLMISDNLEVYRDLFNLMQNKPLLSLLIGIKEGVPYYQTEIQGRQERVFITKKIYQQIHNYLKNGIIPDKMPEENDVYDVLKNENFILHHLKVDNANKVTTYSEKTKEYKAKYPNGIINYGQLPYSPNELKAKLNLLQ